MKKFSKHFILIGILLLTISNSIDLLAQNWLEKLEFSFDYDLTGKRILTVVSNNFNYEETIEMSDLWRNFGAEVTFTGASDIIVGEKPEFSTNDHKERVKPELNIEIPLHEITSSNYDLLYIAGGEGIKELLEQNKDDIVNLVRQFYEERKIIAALCHGPLALSASTLIEGKKATANGNDEREELLKAGAVFVDDIIVYDDGFLTGQWPFLETFAFTVSEKLQFGSAVGPFQIYLQSMNETKQMLSQLRAASQLTDKNVDEENLSNIIQAAMLIPPMDIASVITLPFKFIRIEKPETKSAIANAILYQIKSIYSAHGVQIKEMEKRLKDRFETPPNLFIAVVDTTIPKTKNKILKASYFRNSVIQYGSARENMVLMSKSFNYGISFNGFPTFFLAEDDIRKIVNLPEGYVIIDMFSIGHIKSLTIPPVSRSVDALWFKHEL